MQEITPEYVSEVYTELKGLRVDLDHDPMVYGPSRLNEKIAESKSALDRCEAMFLRVSEHLQIFRRELRKINLKIKMETSRLLSEDVNVRIGRSKTDREALVQHKLSEEIEFQASLEASVMELEALMEVIKAKRYDLKDTSSRLKEQIRLCRDEIDLGRNWGRKSLPVHVPSDDDHEKIASFILRDRPELEGDQSAAEAFLDEMSGDLPPEKEDDMSWENEILDMFGS